ncbi:hypothetical protein LINPERPRIM_LOCUS23706 [Linum perenne]
MSPLQFDNNSFPPARRLFRAQLCRSGSGDPPSSSFESSIPNLGNTDLRFSKTFGSLDQILYCDFLLLESRWVG